MKIQRMTGMAAYTILTLGQGISKLGSSMTRFATMVWAWQLTGEATTLALVAFYSFLPKILASPFAGALVDRLNRRVVMAISDLAAGFTTIVLLILHLNGILEVWHLYVTGAVAGAFSAFQFPAFSAATSAMLSKDQYTRASGMMSLANNGPGIAAPMLASVLLAVSGFASILVIDVATFTLAVLSLLALKIPTSSSRPRRTSFLSDAFYGFRYILSNKSLLSLQLVFFTVNLVAVIGFTVQNPMILARTDGNEVVLGMVQSIAGTGGIVGGLVLSLWGGPKRKIHMLLGGIILVSLFGQILMSVGREVVIWSVAAFSISVFAVAINGANQAIWQSKVAVEEQGRVFATRAMIAQVTTPLAMLAAGPLADYVLEPAMMPSGSLAPFFGQLIGVGPGAGMALMLFFAGCLAAGAAVVAYTLPWIRYVETEVPDHISPTPVDSQRA